MGKPHQRLVLATGIGTALVLLALPVISQTSNTQPQVPASESDAASPKSLLPEGFDGPASNANDSAPPMAPDASVAGTLPTISPLLQAQATPVDQPDPFAAPTSADIAISGPLTPANGGYGVASFSGSNGVFLESLARRMTAPVASRWAAITLRRALLSQSATPWGISPGDWIAARAWLLLRMGELDGAKLIVDAVPIDRYTPSLYRIAGQVALAGADIGGLCPIAVTGQALSKDPLWKLAVGMCAAVQGDDITAATMFDALNGDNKYVDPFDVRLGERVATVAGGAGRASQIDWADAPALTPYRFGIATAAGVQVPADKLPALGPARFGWLVRIAGVAPAVRLDSLRQAAVLGTVSAAELVSGVAALSPGDAPADSRAGQLRTAFAGGSLADRRAAVRAIQGSDGAGDSYGGLIESATAAARLPTSTDSAADSADIIAALLAAGDADTARRWWRIADKADKKVRARAWALLATGSGGVPVTPSDFKDWQSASGADERHAGMLLAALAGLGLADGGSWSGLRDSLLPRTANSWSRAIDAAARAGRIGEVALLTGTALQGRWADVPPLHLYHITTALVRVGRGQEARLIAAEAVTRG